MFLGVTRPGPSVPGGSVHPGPGVVAPGLTPRPLLAPDGVLFDKQERNCPWKQGRCFLGSHRPNGAHIRGLPRGPQPRSQTGAGPGGAGGSQNEGLGQAAFLACRNGEPWGTPHPELLATTQLLLFPVVYTNPGSRIRIMTWGQARSSLGDSRSWGAGSPQWDGGARRTCGPPAPQPLLL